MIDFVQQHWGMCVALVVFGGCLVALWMTEEKVVHYHRLAQDAIKRANALETELAARVAADRELRDELTDRIEANRSQVRQLAAYRDQATGAERPVYGQPAPRLQLLPQEPEDRC